MRVLMTGATGFVGRALVLRLLAGGHQPVALVRGGERRAGELGAEVELLPWPEGQDDAGLRQAVEQADAVVNLAGEPLLGGRWTAARRVVLEESRIGLTQRLVRAIGQAARRPRVLVSASAVGYFGDGGANVLDEQSEAGSGFLADLCRRWEEAARGAEQHGVRVVLPRLGVVLGAEGGALAQMLPPFRLGLGGRLASGRQFLPWIHLADLVELLYTALVDERWSGVFVATSPEPVTNAELTRALGRVLGRPTLAPVPQVALRLLFGDAAQVLLDSQRAVPARALAQGFRFRYTALEPALRDLLSPTDAAEIGPSGAAPQAPYLSDRPPRYLLAQTTRLEAPLEQVFDFFSRPANLALLTPPGLGLRLLGPAPAATSAGLVLDYKLKVAGLPARWRTVIERFEPLSVFVDAQHRGPYASWWHEHHFRRDGEGTLMEDRIYYAPPLGPLGRLAQKSFVAPMLRRIFAFRQQAVRLRFGRRAAA